MHDDRHTHRDDATDRQETVTYGDATSLRGTSAGQLAHLSDLDDWHIAESEPDVRGWDVRAPDGRKIGKVADLLVDTGSERVRYLEIEMDKDVARDLAQASDQANPSTEPTRYALVPIGLARIDDGRDQVLVDARALRVIAEADARPGGARDHNRAHGGAPEDRGRYDDPAFDDRAFFGGRGEGREVTVYLVRSTGRARP